VRWPCGNAGIIQGSTLFRGNDIASHLLSAYCQSVGRKFLLKVIRPLVEKVLTLYSQNKSMEVPARVHPLTSSSFLMNMT
jgi:hypothetical protein